MGRVISSRPNLHAMFLASLLGGTLCSSSLAAGNESLSGLPLGPGTAPAWATPTAEDDEGPVVLFSGLVVHQDGSCTFRVDLTREVPVEFSQNKSTLSFLLRGAKVALQNNRNPLRAEYFGSNVLRTQLNNEKRGTRLQIELRDEAQPEHRIVRHSGGAVLTIEIPAARAQTPTAG